MLNHSRKSQKEEVLGELRKNGVQLEVVKLNVGDFVWVCRRNQNTVLHSNRRLSISRFDDLVLPFVVERKRMDDLASSIRDGRFREQKHRLEETSIQQIYLIESYGTDDWGLADGALSQAVANTQISNRFIIQETESLKDTCAYLTRMTRYLSQIYKPKTLASCSKDEWPTHKCKTDMTYLMLFSDFNEFAVKTKDWTVSEMFARHLMKISGVSAAKAAAIIGKYPTVADLMRAYRRCSSTIDQQYLLASIHYGLTNRTIGKSISKTIHALYTLENFGGIT